MPYPLYHKNEAFEVKWNDLYNQNAFDKSKNIPTTVSLSSHAFGKFVYKSISAWEVLCPFLKPNCLRYKILFFWIKDISFIIYNFL